MRLWVTALLIVLFNSLALAATSNSSVEYESTVGVDGFMWHKPGFTWYDCAQVEKGVGSVKTRAKNAVKRYFRPEAKEACASGKREFIQSGETVDHVLKNGKPQIVSMKVKVGNTTSVQKFYLVKTPHNGKVGWMSSTYLRDPVVKEFEAPPVPVAPPPKPPVIKPTETKAVEEKPVEAKPTETKTTEAAVLPCHANPRGCDQNGKIEALRTNAAEVEAVVSKMAIGPVKTSAELDRYMCINRDISVSAGTFARMLPQIRKSAEAAEKAFGIPSSVLKCVMLVESALVSDAKSDANAAGLLQALEGTVEQLQTVAERETLGAEWKKYKSMQPMARLTNQTLRTRSNVTSSMGGIGLYLRHMQEDYIKKSCKNCSSTDGMLTRKEIYLMIVGYNAGPGAIPRVSNKSAGQMLKSRPPPKETRDYFLKMDRCLQAKRENEKPHPTLLKQCDEKFPAKS